MITKDEAIDALVAALNRVEWESTGDGYTRCPWCATMFTPGTEHAADCERQRALKLAATARLNDEPSPS